MDMKHSRKSGLTGRQKKQIRLVLLLLPFMIMIGIFSYAPLFGWSYAFVEFTPGVSIFKSQFVGLKYFKKIVEFCKKNNIELTCVTTTITPKAALDGVSEETGRWFANLCSQNGVRYIDFNLVSLDELERTDDDFADWEGHMMGWMAEKYSEVLAKVIRGDNIRFYKDYQEYRMAYESRKGIK